MLNSLITSRITMNKIISLKWRIDDEEIVQEYINEITKILIERSSLELFNSVKIDFSYCLIVLNILLINDKLKKDEYYIFIYNLIALFDQELYFSLDQDGFYYLLSNLHKNEIFEINNNYILIKIDDNFEMTENEFWDSFSLFLLEKSSQDSKMQFFLSHNQYSEEDYLKGNSLPLLSECIIWFSFNHLKQNNYFDFDILNLFENEYSKSLFYVLLFKDFEFINKLFIEKYKNFPKKYLIIKFWKENVKELCVFFENNNQDKNSLNLLKKVSKEKYNEIIKKLNINLSEDVNSYEDGTLNIFEIENKILATLDNQSLFDDGFYTYDGNWMRHEKWLELSKYSISERCNFYLTEFNYLLNNKSFSWLEDLNFYFSKENLEELIKTLDQIKKSIHQDDLLKLKDYVLVQTNSKKILASLKTLENEYKETEGINKNKENFRILINKFANILKEINKELENKSFFFKMMFLYEIDFDFLERIYYFSRFLENSCEIIMYSNLETEISLLVKQFKEWTENDQTLIKDNVLDKIKKLSVFNHQLKIDNNIWEFQYMQVHEKCCQKSLYLFEYFKCNIDFNNKKVFIELIPAILFTQYSYTFRKTNLLENTFGLNNFWNEVIDNNVSVLNKEQLEKSLVKQTKIYYSQLQNNSYWMLIVLGSCLYANFKIDYITNYLHGDNLKFPKSFKFEELDIYMVIDSLLREVSLFINQGNREKTNIEQKEFLEKVLKFSSLMEEKISPSIQNIPTLILVEEEFEELKNYALRNFASVKFNTFTDLYLKLTLLFLHILFDPKIEQLSNEAKEEILNILDFAISVKDPNSRLFNVFSFLEYAKKTIFVTKKNLASLETLFPNHHFFKNQVNLKK